MISFHRVKYWAVTTCILKYQYYWYMAFNFVFSEACLSLNGKKTERDTDGKRSFQTILQQIRDFNQKLMQFTDHKMTGDIPLSTLQAIFINAKLLLTDTNNPKIFVQNETNDELKQTFLLRNKNLALRRVQMRQDLVDLASAKLQLANVKVSLKEVEVDLLEKELRLLQSNMTTR